MNTTTPAAAAALEANRRPDGRFGNAPATEADLELAGPGGPSLADPERWDEPYRAQMRAVASHTHTHTRGATMHPVTGACEADWRDGHWSDPQTGEFEFWTEDVANTGFDQLSGVYQDELMVAAACVDKAYQDADVKVADDDQVESVAREAYFAHRDLTGGDGHWDTEAQSVRNEWETRARLRIEGVLEDEGVQPIAAAVAEHEAEGGVIDRDQYQDFVAWRAHPGKDAPVYRKAGADGAAVPAVFVNNEPTAWYRGTECARALYTDGTQVTYHPGGRLPRLTRSPDGGFTHFDMEGDHHRDVGPAHVDNEQVRYARYGLGHRDPNQGPAVMRWDGEVEYRISGSAIDPTPEQMSAHGVQRYADAAADEWSAVLNDGDVQGRYRMAGSQQDQPFDYQSTPLDPGFPFPGAARA